MNNYIMYKRYQEHSLPIRWYKWLKYIPYAYLRGIYWYIKEYFTCNRESFSFCLGVSIGGIQATKMHWVYSGKEVQEYLNKRKSSLKKDKR